MDRLIIRLQERIRWAPAIECQAFGGRCNEAGEILGPTRPNPPISQATLEAFEQEFGFRLPTFVRRLYTEVADGNYGPNWGINPLRQPLDIDWKEESLSVEGWYQQDRQERAIDRPPDYWPYVPEPSIRLCEVGCGIQICVDCTSDQGRVFMDDGTASQEWKDCIIPVADSAEEWLAQWLDDKPWPENLYSES
jgi:hypothetical protein